MTAAIDGLTAVLGGVYQAEVASSWVVPTPSGRRIPSATVSTSVQDGFIGGISPTSLYVNRLRCKGTNAKSRLTTKGLTGGPFSRFGETYDCFTPRRVLVRVRGDFVKPTAFATESPVGFPQLQALGATRRTELAVATLAGRPIAYASIAGARNARFYVSADCRAD